MVKNLPFAIHFCLKLLEILSDVGVAAGSQGAGGGGEQALLDLAQLEQVFVVGAVVLTGLFLS